MIKPMEVHLTAEIEKKLKDLSAISGRATDELVEDAMAGYFAEVQQIRETLNGRYDDLKGAKVKPIPATRLKPTSVKKAPPPVRNRVHDRVCS
jgi:hypothetical protein